MAVVVADLTANYPEFTPMYAEDPAYVAAVLARADRLTSTSWPEDTRDDQVMLQAAEMLAMSPMGRNAKLAIELTSGRFTTAYSDELKRRKTAFALGRGRVV